jgi:hypothetical protein
MAFTKGTPEERHLKMATLLFDRVYLPVGTQHLGNVIPDFASEAGISPKAVCEVWRSFEAIHPSLREGKLMMRTLSPPQSSVFDESGNWRRGLRRPIDEALALQLKLSLYGVRKLKRAEPYGYIKEGNALANAGVGSVLTWTLLRPYVECSYFAFNQVEFAAAKILLGREESAAFNSANLLLPDADVLTWQEVFEIRDRPEAKSFRRWFHGRMASTGPSRAIESDIVGALLDIIESIQPHIWF